MRENVGQPIIEIKKLGTQFNGEWIHKDLD